MQRPIDFRPNLESSDSPIGGAQPVAINASVDRKGVIRRRPALVAPTLVYSGVINSAGIDGLYAYGGRVFATSGHDIYAVTASGFLALSGGAPGSDLHGTRAPVFAETPNPWIIVAKGGDMQKIDPVGLTSQRLGGTPPEASTVVWTSQRLVSDTLDPADPKGTFRYSDADLTGLETWDTLRRGVAGARPDGVVAIRENLNELFVFGEDTLQVYTPDPNVVWSPSRDVNLGCVSARSVVEIDSAFAWIDRRRRVVASNARGPAQDLSAGISSELEALNLATSHGFRLDIGQFDGAVWRFPDNGRTLCYQSSGAGWSDWYRWDGTNYTDMQITCHHYWRDEDVHLFGLSDGRIVQASAASATDYDGEEIHTEVQSPYQDRETGMKKFCRRVIIELRDRGGAGGGVVGLSYRNDINGAWTSPQFKTVTASQPFVKFEGLGYYRMRQWRLVLSGLVDVEVGNVYEEFEIGRG